MFDSKYFILCVFMGFLATYGSRILPFFLFKKSRENSQTLSFIQKNMPLMIMVILVFYTLFSYDFSNSKILYSFIFCSFLALILQIISKNALLSIFISVIVYMIFLRFF